MNATALRKGIRPGALAAVVLLVAFALWLLLSGGEDEPERSPGTAQSSSAGPPLSRAGLISVAQALGRPVYWVGPRSEAGYEFTSTPAGRSFVRYLPADVRTGDPRPDFLTVATYPVSDPVAAVRRAGREDGARTVRLPGGGVAVATSANPTSAYYARPGWNAQIEVFDPEPGEAMKLVLEERVQPVR
jgi:hypothetical protein